MGEPKDGGKSSGKGYGSGGGQPKAGPYRILCFGDSVTVGFHDNGMGYDPYGRTLADVLNAAGTVACEVCSLGLCGLNSQEMLDSKQHRVVKDRVGRYGKGLLKAVEDDGPFDLVLLLAGTNDIGMERPVDDTFASVRGLHELCAKIGLPTLAILPPTVTIGEPRQDLLKLQELLRSWARTAEPAPLAMVDSEELVPRSLPGHWEPEEFHLNPTGSAYLGRQLAPVIGPLLAQLRPACPGSCSHRILEPTSASLDLMGLVAYKVGESVEVWSTIRKGWCPGQVMKVDGTQANQMLEVKMFFDGGVAVKVLPGNSDGLRRPTSTKVASPHSASPVSPQPVSQVSSPAVAANQRPETVTLGPPQPAAAALSPRPAGSPRPPATPASAGASKLTCKVGADMEVWSKQHKVWCPGKVRQVTEGNAVVSMMLPNGNGATKALPLGCAEMREPAAGRAPDRPLCSMGVLPLTVDACKEGDEVEVWSNSHCCWCEGKVTNVEGGTVQAEFLLPGGTPAKKSIAPSQGGLRRKPSQSPRPQEGAERSPETLPVADDAQDDDIELNFQGELGLMDLNRHNVAPYATGDDVEVWSNSHQAWCSGKVSAMESGLVVCAFTLPTGAQAQKKLPLEDEGLRPKGKTIKLGEA